MTLHPVSAPILQESISTMLHILASVCVFCHTVLSFSGVPVVRTKSGKFRGLPAGEYGVEKFLGLRYAKPPIGALRFRPAELAPSVSGIVDATSSGSFCPQNPIPLGDKYSPFHTNTTQSEDCLFLNIYKPQRASPSSLKAILVWIHGGGYKMGTGNVFDGSILAGLNDVIVVTINYRLGILGFLSTLDENAVGNLGLRDQILALHWIQQNIEEFGGDKNRVTIFGESAGGGSVTQLALTQSGRGLFHRLIAQSGTLLAEWAFAKNPLQYTRELGENVGCDSNETREIVNCLRDVPVEVLVDNQNALPQREGEKWVPVLDGNFFTFSLNDLKHNMKNVLTGEQFSQLDCMIGVCSDEGSMLYEILTGRMREKLGDVGSGGGINEETFNILLSQFSAFILPEGFTNFGLLVPSLRYRYTDWNNPRSDLSRSKKLIELFGDVLFHVPAINLAKAHAAFVQAYNGSGRTYFYWFNQPFSWEQPKPWNSGANHGDDLFYIFGIAFKALINSTEEERTFTRQIMRYWTNFAKTGNPNEPLAEEDLPEWPRYEIEDELYIDLDTTLSNHSVKSRLLSERIAFWTQLFPHHVELLSGSCMEGNTDIPGSETVSV